MLEYSNFDSKMEAENHFKNRAMETRDHFKNGVSLKKSSHAKKLYLCGILLVCTILSYGQYYNPYYNPYQYQQMQQQAQQWAEDYAKNWQQQRQQQEQQAQQWAENYAKNFDKTNGESFINLSKMQGLYEKALAGYKKHIEEYSSYTAMYELAEMYEYGLGVIRNTQTARYWYKKAEDGGVTMGDMGVYGIDQNFYEKYTPKELYEWATTLESQYAYQKYYLLRQAAFRGEKRAALTLALEVDKNFGLKKNAQRAGDVAGWYYVAGMRDESNQLLNTATMINNAETNRMTQQMIDNMNRSSSSSTSSTSSCNSCGSSGKCKHCHGTGYVGTMNTNTNTYTYDSNRICPICQGSGNCKVCYGAGKIR